MEPPAAVQTPAGKTIVVCSDGTGNAYTGTPSNVWRLHHLAVRAGPRQVAVYDEGVGTERRQPGEGRVAYARKQARSIAFGEGVIENLTQLYTRLVQEYEPGDRVFLFGFSRGAFTVRALAGVLHVCGLVPRGEAGLTRRLIAQAIDLYQTSERRIAAERARQGLPAQFGRDESTDHARLDLQASEFKARFSRPCTVDFLGVWDTVKAYGWLRPRSFPALRHNPSVRTVRHAIALDETRAVFKVTGWGDVNPNVREVWFAGDHSDVGGGHTEGNSSLADATLRWMLGEAADAGLLLDPDAKAEVECIEYCAYQAHSTAPRSLWWRGGFYIWDSLLRVELDNHGYPPTRGKRVFRWDGIRKPGDHTFKERPDAKTATLLVHHSVASRLARQDPRYTRARIGRRSQGARAVHPPFDLKTAYDRPICWDT